MITIDRHDPYAFQIIPSDMTADEFLIFGMENHVLTGENIMEGFEFNLKWLKEL